MSFYHRGEINSKNGLLIKIYDNEKDYNYYGSVYFHLSGEINKAIFEANNLIDLYNQSKYELPKLKLIDAVQNNFTENEIIMNGSLIRDYRNEFKEKFPDFELTEWTYVHHNQGIVLFDENLNPDYMTTELYIDDKVINFKKGYKDGKDLYKRLY